MPPSDVFNYQQSDNGNNDKVNIPMPIIGDKLHSGAGIPHLETAEESNAALDISHEIANDLTHATAHNATCHFKKPKLQPNSVQIEEVLDEDFMPGAHEKVYSEGQYQSAQLAAQQNGCSLDRLEENRISKIKPKGTAQSKQSSEFSSSVANSSRKAVNCRRIIPNYVFWKTGTLDPNGPWSNVAKAKAKSIRLKDPIGRKYKLPLDICKTWKVSGSFQSKDDR
jgi:hypothetical protein